MNIMKIIGLIVVVLSVGTFVGGIISWVTEDSGVWPYLLVPIGPFIWGIIQLTKRPLLTSLNRADFPTFQKENCVGCEFADEDAMKNGEPWCVRAEPPEWEPNHLRCLGRSIKREEVGAGHI